jgi:hypothetical protein
MLMSFLQQNQSLGQNRTCLKLSGGGKDGRGREWGEMTQTMCAHVNKRTKKKKERKKTIGNSV